VSAIDRGVRGEPTQDFLAESGARTTSLPDDPVPLIGDSGGPRSYAWIIAPLVAVAMVALGASVTLATAGAIDQALAVGALYAGSAVLAVTPGVAVLSAAARLSRAPLGPATALALVLVGSGTVAMAGFWAWFAAPAFGRVFDAALLLASVAAIAVWGRRDDLSEFGLSMPLMLAFAVGLTFTGFAFVQGGLAHNPAEAISSRYWEASDNLIPLQFAAQVALHRPLSGYLVGNWLSSDRPPLQTGFVLLQWPLWRITAAQPPYQLLSTALSASWLPALWTVFRVRQLATWRITVAVLATAATGVMFFNTIYVWPKMLAGTFALAALAILVSRDEADRRPAASVLAVALVTLSMLAHGGTAFAVLAMIPFAYRLRREFTLRVVAWCAAAAVALYVPWMLYQRFVDPPGSRLIKWQLAGQIPVSSAGILQTIVARYRSLSLHTLLANKVDNVFSLVANPVVWHTQQSEAAWASGFLGFARIAQINDLVPAAGPLLLGVVALMIPSARRALAPVAPLAAFTALALGLWVVLLWGGEGVAAINHQGAYAAMVLFIGLCALAVTALPRALAALIVAGGVAWFVISWVRGFGFIPAAGHPYYPRQDFVGLDPGMLALCVAGLVVIAATIAWMRFGPDSRPTRPRHI
jgi:hypothetical protein